MNQLGGHNTVRAESGLVRSILLSRWFLPIMLVLASAIRLCWIFLFRPNPVSDYAFYFRSAESIAEGFGYSAHGAATAYFPVGYPLFLGILFRAFGISVTVAEAANLFCSVASLVLAYRVARYVSGSEVAARLFLLFVAVYPNNVAYTSLASAEIFYLFLLFLGVDLLLPSVSSTGGTHAGRLLMAGFVFGVATLVKVQTLLLPAFLLLLFPQFSWEAKSLLNRLKRGAVLYVPLILVLCPWVIRNYGVFNGFVLSNNGGINLYIGNGPGANGTWVEPPIFDTSQGVMHDYRNDQAARREAIAYIETHPWQTMTLFPEKFLALIDHGDGVYWNDLGTPKESSLQRTALLWLDEVNRVYESAIYVLFAGSLFWAGWKELRWGRESGWSPLGIVVILYFAAIYLVFYGASRYNFPIIPWMIMYSAALLSSILSVSQVFFPKSAQCRKGSLPC